MALQTTFMTLPAELRERVYEYIASSNTTRRVQTLYSHDDRVTGYKITTSAISATSRLVHREYEAVARKAITVLHFTATNWDFTPLMNYFRHNVDSKYLAKLRQNKATIVVNIVINHRNYQRDIADFYPWPLFLIDIKLEAAYRSEIDTWMEIHIANNQEPELEEQCLIKRDTPDHVRDNMGEIRNLVAAFDRQVWQAYPDFSKAMQKRYLEAWNRIDGLIY